MFLLFFPRQHVETLKEAKMRDGNFCLQTRLQGKTCGFHLIRAKHLHAGWGLFLFLFSSEEFQEVEMFQKKCVFYFVF